VQLQELNLEELKVVLREIKDTGNRIFAEAKILRKLSLTLADTLVMLSLNIGRLARRGRAFQRGSYMAISAARKGARLDRSDTRGEVTSNAILPASSMPPTRFINSRLVKKETKSSSRNL
jgi:hypothetical protein